MKGRSTQCILLVFLWLMWVSVSAQTITMTGTNGGSNTASSCSGSFVDAGGAGAYPNTVGNFTQVLCAPTGTDILHLTFATLNLTQGGGPSNDDDIRVYLGNGTGGPLLYDAAADVVASDLDFYSAPGGCLTVVFIQSGTNNGPAPGWSASMECLNTAVVPLTSGTTIVSNHTYFTDPGGLNGFMDASPSSTGGTGFYSNGTGNYYTICPGTVGTYVTLNFLEFNIEFGYEAFLILDGGISGGIIGSYTGTTPPAGPITSSSADGCLTLWFTSDANFSAPGWLIEVTNSTTRGSNVYCCEDYNCSGGCGNWICVSGEFQPNTGGGQGCVEDIRTSNTQSCMGAVGEVNSTWYYFSPAISGTLGFNIDPPNGLDFDYAIWKSPTNGAISCPLNTNTPPIRCSYGAANGSVGLNFTSTDTSEGAVGDNWTRYMDVQAGETYMMLLNCFSSGSPQANPLWTWTGTATLSCTPVSGVLAADFLDFFGRTGQRGVELVWLTGSEQGSSYFDLVRGSDPTDLHTIARLEANQKPSRYSHLDAHLPNGTYYYQVREHDNAGNSTQTEIIEVHFGGEASAGKLVKIVNMLGEDVTANPPRRQPLVKVYDNGQNEKYFILD